MDGMQAQCVESDKDARICLLNRLARAITFKVWESGMKMHQSLFFLGAMVVCELMSGPA